MNADRRRFTRHIFQNAEFHIFSHDSTDKIGRLIDISKGGVAVQIEAIKGEKPDYGPIDITLRGEHQLGVFGLNYRIIYDIHEIEESQSFTGHHKRRRGLEYVKLTKNQEEQLAFLLTNFYFTKSINIA